MAAAGFFIILVVIIFAIVAGVLVYVERNDTTEPLTLEDLDNE